MLYKKNKNSYQNLLRNRTKTSCKELHTDLTVLALFIKGQERMIDNAITTTIII